MGRAQMTGRAGERRMKTGYEEERRGDLTRSRCFLTSLKSYNIWHAAHNVNVI